MRHWHRLPRETKDAGAGFGQPGLKAGVPAHSRRLESDGLQGSFFELHDSMNMLSLSGSDAIEC